MIDASGMKYKLTVRSIYLAGAQNCRNCKKYNITTYHEVLSKLPRNQYLDINKFIQDTRIENQ